MDVSSALKGDSFRPFATVVSPGAMGLAPWAALLYTQFPTGRAFWDMHPLATGIALFTASIAAGLVFENIGARVECHIDDSLASTRVVRNGLPVSEHLDVWYRYLRLEFVNEPVGQRYLRTVLFRLKFELGVLGSLVLQVPGWFVFLCALGTNTTGIVLTMVALVAAALWLFYEAVASAKVLARVRKELVEKYESAEVWTPAIECVCCVCRREQGVL